MNLTFKSMHIMEVMSIVRSLPMEAAIALEYGATLSGGFINAALRGQYKRPGTQADIDLFFNASEQSAPGDRPRLPASLVHCTNMLNVLIVAEETLFKNSVTFPTKFGSRSVQFIFAHGSKDGKDTPHLDPIGLIEDFDFTNCMCAIWKDTAGYHGYCHEHFHEHTLGRMTGYNVNSKIPACQSMYRLTKMISNGKVVMSACIRDIIADLTVAIRNGPKRTKEEIQELISTGY